MIVPPQFLFRARFPVRYVAGLPDALDPNGGPLPAEQSISGLGELDPQVPKFDLRAAWNEEGLAFSVSVEGRSLPPIGNPDRPTKSEGLFLWIDTRNTQDIHRASRYCHAFCCLPNGGGEDGAEPVVIQTPVPRAREDAPLHEPEEFLARTVLHKDRYSLTAFLPAGTLNGFRPAEQPEIGFYAMLRDAELGTHYLGIGDEFPYESDPSLWSTLQLRPAE
ncbi:hypothetical protein [Maioricimonas sp. JC845]|uniref:hypothetical protein n=1 Tax=Maioricimonas sp. JC845 TaxID=3232138 RepID=UPI0034589CA0